MQAFHNTPSLGYIAWQDVHIQYKGVTYGIPDGNTDKRFVIWRYADPDCFYGSDEFPTLGSDDLLVFLNKNGTYSVVPKTQIVDGSLIVSDSIMTDALAANSVTTEKIAAGAITADLIAANAVGAGAIAAGAVTADEIAAGVIATGHLAALAVTADKIAANAVSADKIAANAVGAEKIAAGAITAEKLSVGVAEGMTGPIDADDRPISALDNQIQMGSKGLRMRLAGDAHDRLLIDSTKMEAKGPDPDEPTFMVNFRTGEAYFAGDVITSGQIWKAVAPPRPVSLLHPTSCQLGSLTGMCIGPDNLIYLAFPLVDSSAVLGMRIVKTDFSGRIIASNDLLASDRPTYYANSKDFCLSWRGERILDTHLQYNSGTSSWILRRQTLKTDLTPYGSLATKDLGTYAQTLVAAQRADGSTVNCMDRGGAVYYVRTQTDSAGLYEATGLQTSHGINVQSAACIGDMTYVLAYMRPDGADWGMYLQRFDGDAWDSTYGARRIHDGFLLGSIVADGNLLQFVFRAVSWPSAPAAASAYPNAILHATLDEEGQWVQNPRLVAEMWGVPYGGPQCGLVDAPILGRSNQRLLAAMTCLHDIAPVQWFSMEKLLLRGASLPELAQEITI